MIYVINGDMMCPYMTLADETEIVHSQVMEHKKLFNQIDFWTGKYYEISSGVFLLLRISTIYYKYYKIYLFLKYLIIRISK